MNVSINTMKPLLKNVRYMSPGTWRVPVILLLGGWEACRSGWLETGVRCWTWAYVDQVSALRPSSTWARWRSAAGPG